MTQSPIQISSRLQPLTVHDRLALAIKAWNFYSPLHHETVLSVLGLPATPSGIQPLSVFQFLLYLEKTGAMANPIMCISQIKGLLDVMEREGLLVAVGHGDFMLAPKMYYSLKQLTKMEGKGWTWLTPALGPDFLYTHFGTRTVHIIGDSDGQERGGTGWIISPRNILTCAHVLTGMAVRTIQQFGAITCTVTSLQSHPSIDVGVIEISEPCLPAEPPIGFRDPVIGEQLYILGYPPVPMATEAALILQGGEVVNQGISGYNGQDVFLYSAIARPGNSGGPIIAKSGHILGIVTEDRFNHDHPHALFFAGISTSTIEAALLELDVDVKLPIETYE